MTEQEANQVKQRGGCIRFLLRMTLGIAGIIALLFVLRAAGVFGKSAEQLYTAAADPFASAQIASVFEEHNIEGVIVKVVPVDGEIFQHAFILLDVSRGYTGLSPTDDTDGVFGEVITQLSVRNLRESLRISRVAVEYRDEAGDRVIAFTAPMDDVDAFAIGNIDRQTFMVGVHFSLLDTIQYFGLLDALKELQQ